MEDSIYISVIIPNYCHSLYLDQRIQSVLNQTYQNFELIILDDCSPDEGASKCVIEKYRNDAHVTSIIYNDTNSGSTFIQWNKGISIAQGEYIWIAESDDFCEPNMLELFVSKLMIHKDVSLVYALSQFVNQDGQIIKPFVKSSTDRVLSGHDFISRYMCCQNSVGNASSAIFKKDVALRITPFYMDYKGGGDRLFWIEIAEFGNVVIVNKPLNYFRQHNNKVTPKRYYDGTNYKEAYRTFCYLKDVCKIDCVHRYLALGYYRHSISTRKFSSEKVRKELFSVWGMKKNEYKIQRFLGHAYSTIRYYLNIHL